MTAATLDSASAAATADEIALRPATSEDYEAAARLFRSDLGATFALDPELWRAVCEANTHRAVLAETADGTAVGLAVVIVSDRIRLAHGIRRRRFHIDHLIVSPEARRRGIGKKLLQHIIAMAQEARPSYVISNCDFTNVAARRTYESAGLYLVRQSADRFEIAFS